MIVSKKGLFTTLCTEPYWIEEINCGEELDHRLKYNTEEYLLDYWINYSPKNLKKERYSHGWVLSYI